MRLDCMLFTFVLLNISCVVVFINLKMTPVDLEINWYVIECLQFDTVGEALQQIKNADFFREMAASCSQHKVS